MNSFFEDESVRSALPASMLLILAIGGAGLRSVSRLRRDTLAGNETDFNAFGGISNV